MMIRLLIVTTLFSALTGLQWSDTLPDHSVLYVCVGSDIHLPWTFSLAPGQRVEDINWVFQAEGRAGEMMAMWARGNFLAMPAFSGRVQRSGDAAEIVVSRAGVLDSGNYSVEISTETANHQLLKVTRTVFVHIVDHPMTEDGEMHVQQATSAVYDTATSQWKVQLTCGVFTDLGLPPIEVVWMTPDGQELHSTSQTNGTFHLLVPNPPSGGNYSCSLPPLSPSTRCLTPLSPLLRSATVNVDQVKVTFTLLEAKQNQLAEDNEQLKTDLNTLKAENRRLNDSFAAFSREMWNETAALRSQLNTATHRVSFHGRLQSTLVDITGRLHTFTRDVVNQGGAFNTSTGIVTAPVNGTYYFIGVAGTSSSVRHAYMYLVKNGIRLSRAWSEQYSSYETMSSCNGILHLDEGDQVWLESVHGSSYYDYHSTTFSGFLISADE